MTREFRDYALVVVGKSGSAEAAQVFATLALAEAQDTANLIAYGNSRWKSADGIIERVILERLDLTQKGDQNE